MELRRRKGTAEMIITIDPALEGIDAECSERF